jgi:hypothetical protein
MPEKKEPMISQESRPTAIDFDMPIADFKLRDLYAVIHGYTEYLKPEYFKPEYSKPEYSKPEYSKPEYLKPEYFKPEYFKPEYFKPEHFKPEKEVLKPEKELSKPEKPFDRGLVEQVVELVIQRLKAQGVMK